MKDYRKALTGWYNHSKRELPWRESRDPYTIWVSEVILQQTRVQQGMEYYHNFLFRFPDIPALAMAPEEEVLKVWQGLGYYSRARNMHHAAKTMMKEHGGKFPADYSGIRSLKGIGDYTAAAIASIAFHHPYAVVDGNVFRVLSRLFAISTPIDTSIGKKEFYALAQALLDVDNPGEFNQAIMEFGALHCLPAQPLCGECPLSRRCLAFTTGSVTDFPKKSKQAKQKARFFNYLYVHQSDHLFLEKRGEKDIWRNLYQFPLIETPGLVAPETVMGSPEWEKIVQSQQFILESVSPEKIHLLTHQRLHIRFYRIKLEGNILPGRLIPVKLTEISSYAVPKPVENFLLEMGQ